MQSIALLSRPSKWSAASDPWKNLVKASREHETDTNFETVDMTCESCPDPITDTFAFWGLLVNVHSIERSWDLQATSTENVANTKSSLRAGDLKRELDNSPRVRTFLHVWISVSVGESVSNGYRSSQHRNCHRQRRSILEHLRTPQLGPSSRHPSLFPPFRLWNLPCSLRQYKTDAPCHDGVKHTGNVHKKE